MYAYILATDFLKIDQSKAGLLHNLGVRVVRHDEAQEELVDDLQVRPRPLEGRLLVVRVRRTSRAADFVSMISRQ